MKMRDSNIELLRIISILLIVASHFSVHGSFVYDHTQITFNKLFLQLLPMGGNLGLDLFVLITGYFLISSSGVRIKKLLSLWLQMLTYSVLLLICVSIFLERALGIKLIVKHLFPVVFENWWFASTYFILYIISPYINKFIHELTKSQLRNLIYLLSILWVIIPTFLSKSMQSSDLLFFIYLYIIGSYIRLYSEDFKLKKSKYFIIAIVLVIFAFMSVLIFDILGMKYSIFATHARYFLERHKIPVVLLSICLFIGFTKINIGKRKIINLLSSATFGVYLIHDAPIMRVWLWEKIFKNNQFLDSPYLIGYAILVTVVVYTCATVIELIRQNTLEKLYAPSVSRFGDSLQDKLEKVLSNRR